ncbi:MAG: hypothetical protein KI786_14705 [Mameliella sp.]|nr:hypothetical protein [Phaeodactylibacter sp.]NRA52454.1 hypothetical protein [Phaeodactylibacter sp.]
MSFDNLFTATAMAQYVDVVPTLYEAAGGDLNHLDSGITDGLGRKPIDGKSFLGVLLGKEDTHRDKVYGIHTTRGVNIGSEVYPVRSVRTGRYKYIRNLAPDSTFFNLESTLEDRHYLNWMNAEITPEQQLWLKKYQHRPQEELYDLTIDPWEQNNLSADDELQEVRQTLSDALDKWMLQQGDDGVATEWKALERMTQHAQEKWKPYYN